MATAIEPTARYDESGRLEALNDYQVLGTEAEAPFDDITYLAAQACSVPICLVSLIDSERQWFKSKVGVEVSETPRDIAFCDHAIQDHSHILEVEDARQDQRFAANPLVNGPPHIRFYAGAPLVTPSSYAIGTLCVIDQQPRRLTASQRETLTRLSRLVVAQLEAGRNFRELQRTTEALRRSEGRLLNATEGANCGLWDWEIGTDCVWYSPRFVQLLGYDSSDEFPATLDSFKEHLHPDDQSQVWEDVSAHFRSGTPYDVEYRLRSKQGGYRWFRATGGATRNHRGEAVRMSGAIQDITDRKAAAGALERANSELELRVAKRTAQLADSRARYQDLYDQAPDMFVSFEVQTGIITNCNRKLLETLGYEMEELVGCALTKLTGAAQRSVWPEVSEQLLATREVRNKETQLRTRDGQMIDVSINISSVRQGDVNPCARAVCRDITEQRRLQQEAVKHQEELAQALRMATIGEMASTIAHELNQPLYSIVNFARGAVRRLAAGPVDRGLLRTVMDEIAAEAGRAGEIIRGIRRCIAKGDRPTSAIKPHDLVDASLRVVGRELQLRGIEVAVQVEPDLPETICDKVLIEQVLINLLLNAADALEVAGRISAPLEVEVRQRCQGEVEFTVRDRGQGIAQEDLPRIFDAFYTTKPGGLGMGLAICRTIVEHHRGSLTAANHEDGAAITFVLPSVESEQV